MTRRSRMAWMLRCYRNERGATLREIAKEMGIPHSSLHHAESNGAGMSLKTFSKVLDWMLGGMPK